jgi:serine/threonine protein kinase
MDQLQVLGLLGRGAFGSVSLVRCRVTDQCLALKAVSKGMLVELQLQSSLKMEKEVMQALSSPFAIKLAATFNSDQYVFFLMEAAMGGDLHLVYRQQRLFGSQPHARFFVGCVALAFEHMHSRFILFRDLKMENIVIDSRGYAKLCDFGTAAFAYRVHYTMCGTPEYMSPEVIRGIGHHCPADWWTLGILTHELLFATTPFEADDPLVTFDKITKRGLKSVKLPDRSWAEIVRGLLDPDPDNRLPMRDGGIRNLKEQAWFAEAGGQSWWAALERRALEPLHVPSLDGPEDMHNFAAADQEAPQRRTYHSCGTGWDASFEDKVGPRVMK